METQFLNFKVMEVVGATKEEALAKAPFKIMGDATPKYKKWLASQNQAVTEKDKRAFFVDYLAKKSKNIPNVGFSITVNAAVADTRERPYKIENVKSEQGPRAYKTIYQVISNLTGKIIAEIEGTKADAKARVRDLYLNGLKEDVTCTYTKRVVKGEPIAFKGKYTPSKASHPGTYVVFGIEN